MIGNTAKSWGWPAKLFHWVGAIAILVLLVHGWWMTHQTPRADRLANYTWHAALGYDVLAFLVLRMVWRWMNAVPDLPKETKSWERAGVYVSHVGLYVLMFAVSLTGWALAGTFRTPLRKELAGFDVPSIVASQDRQVHQLFENSHTILSYLLAIVIVVHIAAALRHHLVKRNDVLRRIAW